MNFADFLGGIMAVLDWIETYIINGVMAFGFPFLLALLSPFL